MTAVPVISIIDDDASIRAGLNNLVRSLGYIAWTFASAEDFLTSTQLNDTWCVIADVRMPAMNGIQLQILLRDRGCRVPFIFITALPEEHSRRQALSDGAVCYLAKPFDESVLLSCLDTAVDHHLHGTIG